MNNHASSTQQQELLRAEKKLTRRIGRLQARIEQARQLQQEYEEQLVRAQSRLRKRMQQSERLTERLSVTQIQLQAVQSALQAQTGERAPTVAVAQPEDVVKYSTEHFLDEQLVSELANDTDDLVQRARSIAASMAAAAQLANDRVNYATERMAKMDTGRHLTYEYIRLKDDADRVQDFALKTARTADKAEQVATAIKQLWTGNHVTEQAEKESSLVEQRMPSDRVPDDEAAVGMLAAELIAHDSAHIAEEAEVRSETASAYMQQASALEEQANHILQEIRSAIEEGNLSGEEARLVLEIAEQEVGYIHMLAAHSGEDKRQTMEEAMNADAQAEVTAGMAVGADEQSGEH